MKVSIIIPVFNVQNYIIRCLNSVCQQTYHNIECILIDDCGQDDSVRLAEDYIKRYSGKVRFTLLHHAHNEGLSGARNTGIKVATGEYLFFLDSDDAITPDCIATLVNLASKYPQADFIQGNILGDDNKPSPYAINNTLPEYCDDKNLLEHLMLHCIITTAWNRLVKRKLIIQHQLFFPIGIIHEDMYWIYFLSKKTRAAAFSSKETYIYTVHDGSIMTAVSYDMRVKRLDSRLIAAKAYYQDLKNSSATSHSRRAYLCINLFSCLNELIQLRAIKQWITFWKYVCKIGITNLNKVTIPRFLFLLVLLPPFCFYARKKQFRWRIQQRIISQI